MNERFRPNTFERLAQGDQARVDQIEAAKEVFFPNDPEVVHISSHERATFIAVVPLILVMLTAVSCSGGGGETKSPTQQEPTQEQQQLQDSFADNLPKELFMACQSYVASDLMDPDIGADSRQRGLGSFTDYRYGKEMDDLDPRAFYIWGVDLLFVGGLEEDLESAAKAFVIAVDKGIPIVQETLALEAILNISAFLQREEDSKIEAWNLTGTMQEIADDLEFNVCPR